MTGRLALVTGGTGFVGSHIVDELLEAGYRVRTSIREGSDLRWIRGKPVEAVRADLMSDELAPLVEGVDVTFHVAGLTRGTPGALHRANVGATRRLVEALSVHPGHRFLLCSSQAAAGPSREERPREAHDPAEPTTHYGRSKLEAEGVVWSAGEALRATVIRPTAVYGPRDRDTLPFFTMARRGIVLTPGIRRRVMQVVHGRDLAAAFRLAAERPDSAGRTYFVGNPQVVTWGDVARCAGRAVGRSVVALPVPSPGILAAGVLAGAFPGGRAGRLDARRARDLVARAWTCDVEPALTELGWTPAHDLERGFRDAAEWYRREGWS